MSETERASPRFSDADAWQTPDLVDAMLEGQLAAVAAVRSSASVIAAAIDAAAVTLGSKGRLVYAGAGTSGRVAVQDGAELPPTFNWPRERLVFAMAGGEAALTRSVEGAEDDATDGVRRVTEASIGPGDVVIGVAASGTTPFTIAIVTAARAAGALTISISSNKGSPLLVAAEHPIAIETGVEIVAGSTRMKAGTAQKVVLNMLSTGIMIRLGRIYRGRMVDMAARNAKLDTRARVMVADLAGCDASSAERALAEAGGEVKLAILLATGVPLDEARHCLTAAGGNLRAALAGLERDRISVKWLSDKSRDPTNR